jgi:hypothetical protein
MYTGNRYACNILIPGTSQPYLVHPLQTVTCDVIHSDNCKVEFPWGAIIEINAHYLYLYIWKNSIMAEQIFTEFNNGGPY